MGLNIHVSGLSFSFSSRQHCLNDVALSVNESELCCLLGPNGAGKTTLIRCIVGLLRPQAGSMHVAGRDIGGLSARQRARLVAYLPQSTTTIFPFSAIEMVVMGRTPYLHAAASPSRADRQAALTALDRLGIPHLASRPFPQLSGGERQLVLLARALVQEAPVLVLDEPTASLDYGNEVRFLQIVTELVASGPTVLMTTHQPNHATMWADQAVLMRDGAVMLSGPPGEVITGEQLSSLYNMPVRVARIRPDRAGQDEQVFCLPDVNAPHRPSHGVGPSPASPSPAAP
jgi:iron complex transport system ATP-binding protein